MATQAIINLKSLSSCNNLDQFQLNLNMCYDKCKQRTMEERDVFQRLNTGETASGVRLPQQQATEQTAHRFVLMVSVLLPVAWQHICHDSTGYSYPFNAMQETWNLDGRLGILIQNNKRTFPSLILKKKFNSFNEMKNIKCVKERSLHLKAVSCKHRKDKAIALVKGQKPPLTFDPDDPERCLA